MNTITVNVFLTQQPVPCLVHVEHERLVPLWVAASRDVVGPLGAVGGADHLHGNVGVGTVH